jgi:uncharacterized membrane protein (UPF0127 family)
MPWLVRDGDVLASVEVARSRSARRKGLLGRDSLEGALLLEPARSVHTLGMRFDIDVAFLDAEGVVRRAVRMRRHRVGLPCFSARSVVEAEAGAFARWNLSVGQKLEVVE